MLNIFQIANEMSELHQSEVRGSQILEHPVYIAAPFFAILGAPLTSLQHRVKMLDPPLLGKGRSPQFAVAINYGILYSNI